MPKKTTKAPSQAEQILAANVLNLQKKVEAGETLTGSEIDMLQSAGEKRAPAQDRNYAANASELAAILGTSRQRIGHHCKLPGNPGRRSDGRYSIAEWRDHLATFGRKLEQPGHRHHGAVQGLEYGDGIGTAFEIIGDTLDADTEVAMVNAGLAPGESSAVARFIWLLLATRIDEKLRHLGFDTFLDPADGENTYPEWMRQSDSDLEKLNHKPVLGKEENDHA